MGLFNALNLGENSLLAQQRALDVVGQNIANASTEGYSRQRIELSSLAPSRFGNLFIGNGVGVSDIRRVFDQQVENRLQRAKSTLGSLDRQSAAYEQLERAINALGDDPNNGIIVSLGGQLDQFFQGLQNLASDPSSPSNRALFISESEALTSTFRKLADDVLDLRESLNESVEASVRELNQYIKEIASLNDEIVRAEVGGAISGQANDLRDRRDLLIRKLSELSDIQALETQTGAVDIRVGGDLLVSGNDYFTLETSITSDRGIEIAEVEFALNGSRFEPREGALGGLLIARDEMIPGFLADIDTIARTLIQSFNKIHATGRGIKGLQSVQSDAFSSAHALNSQLPISIAGKVQHGNEAGTFLVDSSLRNFPAGIPDADFFVDAKVLFTSGENAGRTGTVTSYDPATGRLELTPPLSSPIEPGDSFEVTSLPYAIQNGSFKFNIHNETLGITDVFDIEVDRDGLPLPPNLDDTSLQDLVNDINQQLDTFYGGDAPVQARITDDFRLEILSTESDVTFHFSEDSSGFLAAAGINTFFTGSDAFSINVQSAVRDNHNLFASATSSIDGDNSNVQRMIGLGEEKLLLGGSSTIQEFYRGVIGTIAVETATAKELATNQEVIAQAAQNAREQISGVNIDEEAINLIKFQRAFQASARYLSVVDELLASLIQIV